MTFYTTEDSASNWDIQEEVPSLDLIPPHRRRSLVKLSLFISRRLKRHCAKALAGNWLNPDSVEVQQLYGGLSNYIYSASLKNGVPEVAGEPRKLLVRIYGEVLRNNMESVVMDSVVFTLLSEKGIGPKLYGVFPGGRIEEFIESRPLTMQELALPAVNAQVSKHMAVFHHLTMPLNKSPTFVFKSMDRFIEQLSGLSPLRSPTSTSIAHVQSTQSFLSLNITDESEGDQCCNPSFTEVAEYVRIHDIAKEAKWLKFIFFDRYAGRFPVVFCHNDFQENNLLVLNDGGESNGLEVIPIDFEYCSYNFRGFDIGNHFNEWTYDYTIAEPPYFKSYPDRYPSQAQQIDFWLHYLAMYGTIQGQDDKNDGDSDGFQMNGSDLHYNSSYRGNEMTPDHKDLLVETIYGSLLSHLFWSTWSLVQTQLSSIKFCFFEYGKDRFKAYEKMKKQVAPEDLELESVTQV